MNINVKEIAKNHYWSQFHAFLLNKAMDEECLAVMHHIFLSTSESSLSK